MKRRQIGLAVLLIAVLAAAGRLAWGVLRPGGAPLAADFSAAAAVPAGDAGFDRADGARPLVFPADFGPHDAYQTEWWYYTGNLDTADGRHFGYQLTFFRRALLPPAAIAPRQSDLAASQVYLAHFALTDVAAGRHYAYARLERGAGGLAGAVAQPYRVWLDNWSVAAGADGQVHLAAAEGDLAVQLDLDALKAPVLQGVDGYSRKGPEPGNASYYYSLTRIATQGTLTVDGHAYRVTGLSWMDHEFSTSALSAGATGWDWLSLQLGDGREVMVFQIRHADGSPDPYAAGVLVAADGTTRRLAAGDFTLAATGHWRSPHSGATYPSGWRLTSAAAGLDLALAPYVADQELNLSYTYWEGAVRVQGEAGGRPVNGSGYVELTGYAGTMAGQF